MTPSFIAPSLVGHYSGASHLYLPWLPNPERVCDSALTVALVGKGTFAQLAYTWSYEGVPHEGTIIVGHQAATNSATAAWMDTWHQSQRLMFLTGSAMQADRLVLLGSYAAPPDRDWGWRITLVAGASGLNELIMHNITPDGQESLAVQATYARVASAGP